MKNCFSDFGTRSWRSSTDFSRSAIRVGSPKYTRILESKKFSPSSAARTEVADSMVWKVMIMRVRLGRGEKV